MLISWLTLLSIASAAAGEFHKNLNYRSPSHRHPSLGINLPTITKRGLTARRSLDPETLKFTHGVASGDPLPHSVILWTRVAPSVKNDASNVTVKGDVPLYNHDTESYINMDTNPICIEYQISTDKNFSEICDQGEAFTTSDIDYTVKVEAKNLHPFTQYYYQFQVCKTEHKSPLGRFKTSPGPDDDVSKVSLAVYSCADYANGYFNAYGNPARKDSVDFVVHLGDYIYETSKGKLGKDPRAMNPGHELLTLYDYRTRIAQYRTDEDLLLSHRQFAWIPVWDDHEISNNAYRDGSSRLNNSEASFEKSGGMSVDQRKMNAVRAYFEWMPIRQVDMDDNLRIWRSFQMGKLFDLIMLDTRNYDRSITSLTWNDGYVTRIVDDASRTLMGSHQENWFYGQLSKSAERDATWRIIGNQIVFSRLQNPAKDGQVNLDGWDGYTANRNRTLNHLYSNNISNNIFLAGDSHANWVSDVAWLGKMPYDKDTGEGSIGAEFAGTSVTSGKEKYTNGIKASANMVRNNEELQWSESYYRGYYELHVTPQKLTANYFGCPTVVFQNPLEISLANFTVNVDDNHLERKVTGGTVENGALQGGSVEQTNLTHNTETGKWNVTCFEKMLIGY